ncbi:MAG: hypothetical protein MJZ41_04060 [Bacteroidaceae bacterium]|nr:hypothetical protein [Bacteroidaceae bacterium]
MRRHFISFALLVLNVLPLLAYDRHGRDYSVRDGSGSSGLLAVVVIIAIVLYAFFSHRRKNK